MKILVINGVNMNMLGIREPDKYGDMTLEGLEKELHEFAAKNDITLETFQSNYEGEIVEKIHAAAGNFDGILINAGAYTHTSVAIADAISAVRLITVEVHMTNIYKREKFRHKSYLAPVCAGQISGFGLESYKLGLEGLKDCIAKAKN
jgi:3-dehydroquinate dehydratase-2